MEEKYIYYLYLIVAIVIFIITWKLFDWFSWSIKDTFYSTRWEHFQRKFITSLTSAALIPLIFFVLYTKFISSNTNNSPNSTGITNSINISNIPPSGSAPGYTGPDSAVLITKEQLIELQKKYKEKNINN